MNESINLEGCNVEMLRVAVQISAQTWFQNFSGDL